MKYGQIKTHVTLPFSSLKDLDEYIEKLIKDKKNGTNGSRNRNRSKKH